MMLVSVRPFEVQRFGVVRRFHGVSHPKLWIHIVEHRGSRCDDQLWPCSGASRPTSGRRLVGIVLNGWHRIRSGRSEHWSNAPSAVACDGRGTLDSGEDGLRTPALSVVIEWDQQYFASRMIGGLDFGPLGPRAYHDIHEQIVALRAAIERAWHDPRALGPLATLVANFLSRLRAEGLDLPPVEGAELLSELDPFVRALSRALDEALSITSSCPSMGDVEQRLGLSIRTAQRRLPEVLSAWGQEPETFRSLRLRHQLFRACLVMSHPASTTEATAALTGFSTPNALCRAFLDRGLPSPTEVRRRLDSFWNGAT
jgi:AraC-like DNA-binding protein